MNPQSIPEQNKRPLLLTILCILTFIGSGLSSLAFLIVFLTYSQSYEIIKDLTETYPNLSTLAGAGKNFFLTGFVLNFFSLLGARLMWNLRKAGFHFYTGAQILIVLLPFVFLDDYPFPWGDALISLFFIILYSRFLRIMN